MYKRQAGTLLAAYFAYNQYTKNKLTDLKVEYFKKEEERRSYHRSENSAKEMCIRDRFCFARIIM